MARTHAAPTQMLMTWWHRLSKLPGGRWMFSVFLGQLAPYTGTMGARVEELTPGYARWRLRDRRKVRNHLNSVHAVALMNLAEVASGTAMIAALPVGVRGIVTGLSMEYLKKARGTLIAECRCTIAPVTIERQESIEAIITDAEGDVVARATATWKLSPAQP